LTRFLAQASDALVSCIFLRQLSREIIGKGSYL
jgi:hypothetical protein